MIIYPAIDLLDGRVVRLHKGDFDAVTDYGDDPLKVADAFGRAGAQWLHVVDLSGARDGEGRQGAIIRDLCQTGLRIQTGGGVRTGEDIETLMAAGVDRVIIGSLAATEPDQVSGWLDAYGGERLCLAFDVRKSGRVYRPALQGWTDLLMTTLDDLVERYRSSALRHALVTDIDRDGVLTGPNLDLYRHLAVRYPDIAWQASGGVASLDDLKAVAETGVSGAITGKALYEGRLDLTEALACLQNA